MYQQINEPISVVAAYAKGKVCPQKVEWGKTVYEVKEINNDWRQKIGTIYHLFFSIETYQDISMVIVFDPADLSWRLQSIYVQG